MINKKNIIPVVIAVLLGLSVIITEAGVLDELNITSIGLLTLPLKTALYAAAAFLAWRRYKKFDTCFYRWVTISLALYLVLGMENWLFKQINFPLQPSPELSFYDAVNLANIFLQQGGSILFTVLLVYAISIYDKQVEFFKVFKPRWLILLCSFFTLGVIISVLTINQQQNDLNFAGFMIIAGLKIIIYFYGIVIASQKLKVSIIKWFFAFFTVGALSDVVILMNNLLIFITKNSFYPMFQIYVLQAAALIMPALLVAAFLINIEKNAANIK
ncbi:hypothetical protein [Desulfolucanica intricata]|uniref:hypothetical protein n=1 Tax=Desulfolucanica intricata TaxID=1285191 RepID=UPI00082CE5D1|nr:hypothetical protein [Desulfolucanica intricata]